MLNKKKLTYKELIDKHKLAIAKEYAYVNSQVTDNLCPEFINLLKYKSILFDYSNLSRSYRPETLEELKKLPEEIEKELKSLKRKYHNLKISIGYNAIDVKYNILKNNVENILNDKKSKYDFKRDFMKILIIESDYEYLPQIDCAIIKLYRDNLIDFDTMIKSVKSC